VRIVDHEPSEAPSRRRFGVITLVVVLVVGIAFVWSLNYKLNVYAITPGLSQPVSPLITVSGHPHAPSRKTIYLTDVFLTQLNVWQWLRAEIHPSHEQLIGGSTLTGDVPASELTAQGYLQMYDSQNDAKVAGMRAIGLRVPGVPSGATVTGVGTGSPATGTLAVADRIVGARGDVVASVCGLAAALEGATPGRPVVLRVAHAAISSSGTITYHPPTSVTVATTSVPRGAVLTGCPNAPRRTTWLGIGVEDATAWRFPVQVTIKAAYIGGPSAGLAWSLGVIDALSKVSITGGMKVAATGEIDQDGNVFPVGGVPEKTIAVESAGATVFLVPASQAGQAEAQASPGLRVVPVRTLVQALHVIERLGGSAPVPLTGAVTTGATS
jgi:PDZ domain-containing protein